MDVSKIYDRHDQVGPRRSYLGRPGVSNARSLPTAWKGRSGRQPWFVGPRCKPHPRNPTSLFAGRGD